MYNAVCTAPRWFVDGLAALAASRVPLHAPASFVVPFPGESLRLSDLSLPSSLRLVRLQLVGLLPSQQIPLHADPSIAPAVRYHLVLRMNPDCWSLSGDVWQRLVEGRLYQMDPTVPHGAVNWGDTIRLHLMIDVEGHR